MTHGDPHARLRASLEALVVKDHVHLGSLPAGPRALALALVWAGLPAAAMFDEPALNAALKAQLADAARFLETDHVELRRWLVDAGWLTRDGFGREYRRVDALALPQDRQALVAALAVTLDGVDVAGWARSLRDQKAAERARRYAAWRARAEDAA